MRSMICGICAIMGTAASAASPTITDVTAQQRYPWNGKVDISYTVTGDIVTAASEMGMMHPTVVVTARDMITETLYTATAASVSGDMAFSEGRHSIVWDMSADGLTFKSTNVVFMVAVTCARIPAYETYLVIDLSDGSNATNYPVTYMSSVPANGFNTDEYKTTKLVLRKIPAAIFMMGGVETDFPGATYGLHQVTISKPFYIGVFEVTQRQYELVVGSNPSDFLGEMRPVERVSYDMIRGSVDGTGWPDSSAVDSTSFMGKLRMKTGIDELDLPTEAQWEYACRAGTTTALNNGRNLTSSTQDSEMDKVGRYGYNNGYHGGTKDGKGGYYDNHTTVGSYLPNAWGLYDMHGNVFEWCLDSFGDYPTSAVTDPVGSSSGAFRVSRGGGWSYGASASASSIRSAGSRSSDYNHLGFRLVRNLSDQINTVVISFNGNRGATSVLSGLYTPGVIYGSLPTITRPGYVFAGWFTAAIGGMEVTTSSLVPATSTSLFAHWITEATDVHDKVRLWKDGPYCATANVGAEESWEYGHYFWWGDTVGYKLVDGVWEASDGFASDFSFTWMNTPTYNKGIDTLRSEGWITSDNVLAPEYDAAHVQWGGKWRLPTTQELNDLNNKCDWAWTTTNGVNGYVVRGKGDYASASIFLPCNGCGDGNLLLDAGSYGSYCSSTLPLGIDGYSTYNFFNSGRHYTYDSYFRNIGVTIRPVQGFTK